MSAIEVLGAWASKFLAPLIGTSPDFDRTRRVLAIGRRPCLITAAITNLASTVAPPGSLSTQDIGAMGALALFLSVWVTYQQPVHALRETFGFRKAYAEGANALAETALVASEAREQLTAPIGGGLGGWPTPAA
jgi:hypothetical protein